MTAVRTTLCFLAAASLLGAVVSPVFAEAEPLRGSVVNRSEHGIKDVEVTLRSKDGAIIVETVTDEDGGFELAMESLRPGQEMLFHKHGYLDLTLPVGPQQLVVSTLRVVMEPAQQPATASPTPQPTEPPTLATERQRERAIRLYNQGVELWEDADDDFNKKRDAMQLIRQAASLDPEFPEPLRMLSSSAMKNQAWAEASRYSEALIRIDPDDINAARTIYLCMVIMRHHYRIGEAARRMVELEPDTISSVVEHANTFYSNGQYRMARAMYEVLTELSSNPAGAYLNLGACCLHLDDVECAREAFERFLEVAPEDHPQRESVEHDLAALNAEETPE